MKKCTVRSLVYRLGCEVKYENRKRINGKKKEKEIRIGGERERKRGSGLVSMIATMFCFVLFSRV